MSTATPGEQFALDTKKQTPGLNYLRGISDAAKTGKGLGSLLWEMASLMFGPGRLKADEYFMYRLYDDGRYTPDAKRTFVGTNRCTVPCSWQEIANDKPTITALLRGMNLPVPETQAIVHPTRSFGDSHVLRNREDIRAFLRTQARYPIFGKPFDSVCSLGTANIRNYHPAEDCLEMSSGKRVPVDALVDQIEKLGSRYLFQSLLLPHPEVIPIIGNKVSTVRMFVLSDEEGCQLLRASWKIPVGNGADNFWRRGNVLAGIDVETGRIVRAMRRTAVGTEQIHEHPETGCSFDDLMFPQWSAMREVVLKAAVNLPNCYFQGWDVAITDRGPVLVELEGDGGDPIMEQLCFDSGLMQGRYKKMIDSIPAMIKERKEKMKRRHRDVVRKSFAQLSLRQEPAAEAAPEGATIDPEEVRAAFQNTCQADESACTAETSSSVR